MPKLVVGSILDADADAIVNPANSHLRHGGGLARIIADAATDISQVGVRPENADAVAPHIKLGYKWATEAATDWQQEQDDAPLVPTGGACLTSAGLLPFKGIIHAVGPVYKDASYQEEWLLGRAMDEAIKICIVQGWRKLAVPAISCGIFGFPVEKAAPILVNAAAAWEEGVIPPLEVTFYVMKEHENAFRLALADVMSPEEWLESVL